jgi:hypothetical protein
MSWRLDNGQNDGQFPPDVDSHPRILHKQLFALGKARTHSNAQRQQPDLECAALDRTASRLRAGCQASTADRMEQGAIGREPF